MSRMSSLLCFTTGSRIEGVAVALVDVVEGRDHVAGDIAIPHSAGEAQTRLP